MGQARSRGAREERVALAQGLHKISLDDLKKEYGLSDDAKYLGYAVHLKASDEFLLELVDTTHQVAKTWAKTPELAKRYDRFDLAFADARKCRGAIVVGMFDTGDKIFVATVT